MILGTAGTSPAAVMLLLVAATYFLPTIIATSRKAANARAVVVINLLLGWTGIGWIVALALSASGHDPIPQMIGPPAAPVRSASPRPAVRTRASDQVPPVSGVIRVLDAAWYPDPLGRAPLRYFDGTTWTDHTSV